MRFRVALILVLFLAAQAKAQDSYVLSPLWDQKLLPSVNEKFTVNKLWVEDINKDGRDEAIIVTAGSDTTVNTALKNQINVFVDNGSKLWTYGTDGRITSAVTYDLDNDGRMQFVIATGQTLNKVQRGTIRILGSEGRLLRSYDSSAIMYDINIGDIDGDGYYELVGGSERRAYLFRKYGEAVWMFPKEGKPLLNSTVDKAFIKDIDQDRIGEIIIGADEIYYLDNNGKEIGKFDVEPNNSDMNRGFNYMLPANFRGGLDDVFFITKSGKMGAVMIDNKLNPGSSTKQYKLVMDWTADLNCTVNDLVKFRNPIDQLDEIVVACSNYKVYAINHAGVVIWAYPLDGVPKSLDRKDVDGDGIDDLLVAASSGSIYALDLSGEFKWRYQTGADLVKVAAGDMNGDELTEIVTVSSEPMVEAFQVNSSYTFKRRADTMFNLGQDAYFASNYTQAVNYLQQAQKMYEKLGYQRGIDDTKSLIIKIQGVVVDTRRKEADTMYGKARESFEIGDYGSAKAFLEKAHERYTEFMDTEGVVKCELLKIQIDKAMGEIQPKVTLPPSTTTTTMPDAGGMQNTEGYLIFGILVILAVIIIMVKKRSESGGQSIAETVGSSKDIWEKDMNEMEGKLDGGGKT